MDFEVFKFTIETAIALLALAFSILAIIASCKVACRVSRDSARYNLTMERIAAIKQLRTEFVSCGRAFMSITDDVCVPSSSSLDAQISLDMVNNRLLACGQSLQSNINSYKNQRSTFRKELRDCLDKEIKRYEELQGGDPLEESMVLISNCLSIFDSEMETLTDQMDA